MILNRRKFVSISSVLVGLMLCSNASAYLGYKISSNGLVRLKAKDKKVGFMDKKGKVVIEPKFFRADGFSDGLSTAYKSLNTCGYIDKTGEYVIPPKYTACLTFNEGIAFVTFLSDKHGNIADPPTEFPVNIVDYLDKNKLTLNNAFINQKGELIYKTTFHQSISSFFSDGLGRVLFDHKVSEPRFKTFFVNKKGEKVFLPKEPAIRDFSEGLAAFSKNNKFGYLNKKNEVVIKPVYDEAGLFSEGLASVKIKNLYGYIDNKGTIVIKPRFDWVQPFYDGLARISLNRKTGYIDRKGNIVIKPIYDEASDFSEGLASVYSDKSLFYINKKGEVDKELQKTFELYNK